MSIPAKIEKSFQDWVQKKKLGKISTVTPLAGDGSTRTFYRVAIGENSFVLLFDPEWKFSSDYPAIQTYLNDKKLPVPVFFGGERNPGFLLMADLGDELLQHQIEKEPHNKVAWLKKAAVLLAHLHGKTFPVPEDLAVSERRFDTDKYFAELRYTEEHLCDGYLNLPPWEDGVRAACQMFCEKIAAAQPDVFCHRDYHSRNLLVHFQSLFLIDFQDARLGSAQYDLASLIYDAYVPLTEADRAALIQEYRKALTAYPLNSKMDWDQFEPVLMRVGYQRVLKAAGSFASFYTRFKKPTHLKYIQPALETALTLEVQDSLCAELGKHLNVGKWLDLVKGKKI